jgi:hypothetical protein
MSYQTNMRVLTAEKRSDFALLQQRARGKDATHRSRGGLRPSLTALPALLAGPQVGTKGWPSQSNKGMAKKPTSPSPHHHPNTGTLDPIPKRKHHPPTRRNSARWPASRRNHGRLRLGTGGRLQTGMPGRLRRNA